MNQDFSGDTTVLFADIGSSVRLYQDVGDVAAHRIVAGSLQRMADAISAEGGVLLRTVGDASLAKFADPNAAVKAAIAIQHAHQDFPLAVRVGFHCGPVIEDKGDVYGNAVNIAARIASFARVNEITSSGAAVERLHPDYRSSATLLKRSSVKGLADRIDIYRIDWQADIDAATRIATRVVSSTELSAPAIVQQLEVEFDGQSWVLGSARTSLTIGRTALSDVCVLTDRASRDHAVLEYRDGQFMLSDTSTNGTYIRKHGQPAYAVQRESVVLDGRGVIGVGVEPLDPADVLAGCSSEIDDPVEIATIRFSVEFA